MSPRTGRPIQGRTKKDLRLQLRLNQEEMSMLDECVARTSSNRTAIVMRGVRMVKRELDEEK